MKKFFIILILTACTSDLEYPIAKKETSNYSIHGTKVHDPYEYMEDFESKYVVQWSDQQNALVEGYLEDSQIKDIQSILTKAYSSEYFSNYRILAILIHHALKITLYHTKFNANDSW